MSKAVKSVGRAISKVVKGTVNAVKKVAKSKLGRIILTAAAIYFGGAALAGGLKGAAAGTGFLSGMGTGVANAAAGLKGAWTAATAGNFTGAGGVTANLGAGFQGTTTALQAANAGATPALLGGVTPSAPSAAVPAVSQPLPIAASDAAFNSALAGAKTAPASKGLIAGLSPMGRYAAITGATQILGGAAQGAGQEKQYERQMADAERLRAEQDGRYRASVDEFSRSANAQRDAARETENRYAPAVFDPVAEARAIGERYRSEYDARNPTTGLVARGMQFQQPMTNNNFPVYNPRTFRG
jgi:hypothetical protein